MPFGMAGSLQNSKHNMTRYVSPLGASELVIIPSLKIPPRSSKSKNYYPRAQRTCLSPKTATFQRAISESPPFCQPSSSLVCSSLGQALGEPICWAKAPVQKAWSNTAYKCAFHFSDDNGIILPLAKDAAVLNSSLPLWLGHFSNLKVLLSLLHLRSKNNYNRKWVICSYNTRLIIKNL